MTPQQLLAEHLQKSSEVQIDSEKEREKEYECPPQIGEWEPQTKWQR